MLKISLVLTPAAMLLVASVTALTRDTPPVGLAVAPLSSDPVAITVYHSPTCTCCTKWMTHLQESGFAVTSVEQGDLSALKKEWGVTGNLLSCHTALVGEYVVEGHVPAPDIVRLLTEKPRVAGLTAPGMPQSAPGMDAEGRSYEVLTFDRNGNTRVWARH